MNTIKDQQQNEYNLVETSVGSGQFLLEPVAVDPPPPPPDPEGFFVEQIEGLLAPHYQSMNISPLVLYYNGKTFSAWILDYEQDRNNEGLFHEYAPGSDPLHVFTGHPTPNPDIWNHPGMALGIMPDGHIIGAQVKGHSNHMNVFRSISPGTIADGVELVHTITGFNAGGKYAYPNIFWANGELKILTRPLSVKGGGNDMSQAILTSPGDLTDWSFKLVTKTQYDTYTIRHYPHKPYKVGNDPYHYFVVNMHYDGTPKQTRAIAVYRTSDFIDYQNYDGTYTKANNNTNGSNTQGGLKQDELTANCLVYGDPADPNSNTGHAKGVEIDGTLFLICRVNGTDTAQIIKVSQTGITFHPVQIPDFTHVQTDTSPNAKLSTNADKSRLLVQAGFDSKPFEIWSASFDLTSWVKVFTASEGTNYGAPDNLHEIPANTSYMIPGGNESGVFKAYLTSETLI